ncbi:hypothetical protein CR513_46610, partial [Mucuna pruriens]
MANKGKIQIVFEFGKERFPNLRKSKLLLRRDGQFKVLKKKIIPISLICLKLMTKTIPSICSTYLLFKTEEEQEARDSENLKRPND